MLSVKDLEAFMQIDAALLRAGQNPDADRVDRAAQGNEAMTPDTESQFFKAWVKMLGNREG